MTKDYENDLRKYLKYNPETGIITWKKKPGTRAHRGDEAGSIHRFSGYRRIGFKGKTIYFHRLAWFLFYGAWPRRGIDHKNGIKDDNRIGNLRDVTHQENCQNQEPHRNGRLVGATLYKDCKTNPWRSRIWVGGRRKHIGYFPTEKQAHEAYQKCADGVK